MAEHLTNLIWEVQKEFSAGDELGIDFEEKAFYDILKDLCIKYDFRYPEDKLIILAQAVKDLVDSQAKYPDWSKREDIKSALKVGDRKSTRLNSSHVKISYAVFCLKKKK